MTRAEEGGPKRDPDQNGEWIHEAAESLSPEPFPTPGIWGEGCVGVPGSGVGPGFSIWFDCRVGSVSANPLDPGRGSLLAVVWELVNGLFSTRSHDTPEAVFENLRV